MLRFSLFFIFVSAFAFGNPSEAPSATPATQAAGSAMKILRVGDSITRYAASHPGLCRALEQAGIPYEMVGSQEWPAKGVSGRMEGYNGKTIQFFTSPQKEFGHPDTLNHDAVPIDFAIEKFNPDLILLMVGTNNLGGTDRNEIDVPKLRGFLDDLLNRIHSLAPAAHVMVATAPPARNNWENKPGMAFRNERTAAYNEQVVKPSVTALAAAGRPISLVDIFSALDPEIDLSDGVHPNESGKAKINAQWFAAIQDWRKKNAIADSVSQ